MNKEYYVIKYENKYYCPYLTLDNKNDIYYDVNLILTDRRDLAVRFPSREVAEYYASVDASFRKWSSGFDLAKQHIVKVVKKSPTIQ